MENIIEVFNGIKFLKNPTTLLEASTNAPSLFKVFMSIINCKELELDKHHLQHILSNDLKFELKDLRTQLVAVLVDALMYYIICWPGWQRKKEYESGALQIHDWFARFKQYLIYKIKYIISKATPVLVAPPLREEKGSQTDISSSSSRKLIAPYGLYIEAPTFVLNNIVFEEQNGDILLRRCLEKVWRDPDFKELLHWPNVCISLKLPHISFSRSNVQHVERYMGLCKDFEISSEMERIIHIKKLPLTTDSTTCLMPYSVKFFEQFCLQLVKILKTIPGVLPQRLSEVELVLQEFIFDIKEANIYNKTMCTNVSVRYHIGNCCYLRNRKMIVNNETRTSENQNDVSYMEIITPQMDFSLHVFSAVQDINDNENISFVSLNILEEKLKNGKPSSEIEDLKNDINTTCLIYTCTLCKKDLSGPTAQSDIINHLKTEHRAEQSLFCQKCSKEFEVSELAKNRWLHKCLD